MYVCFGFSFARLRRARTIDLQCQSLSLRRAFLLGSVCLSCVCYGFSLARSRRARTIDVQCQSLSLSSFVASQRVSVMYVCFGFSLARLRRARTIDLQCQSLSLRRVFLLRSVCLSVRLTVESYAVRWPTRSQNESKIIAEINRKSIPGDASGHPKSIQNRSRYPFGHPDASKCDPKASRECLGSVPERPRRAPGVPGGSPRTHRDVRKDALERPGAGRDDPNRRQVASRSGKIEFSSRCAFAKHRRSDFSPIFVDFRFFCEVCKPLKVLRLAAGKNRGPTLRAAS